MNPKRRRLSAERLERRLVLAGAISQLGGFDTWGGGDIHSTDVAGITAHPSGRLYLADSGIDELPVFVGNNLFETTATGDHVFREIASGNQEPTGITFNAFDGYFYVTNNTGANYVTRYDANLNNPRYQFSPTDDVSTADDPEGITSDPSTGSLYVADGSRLVLRYSLDLSNPDEATRPVQFQDSFSVASQMVSVDGIAFHRPSGTLFLVDSLQDRIFEYTTDGTFLEQYDISGFSPAPISPQGLTFAPSSSDSDDPETLSLYIADRGHDQVADGRVYEATIGQPGPPTSPITFRVLADLPRSQSEQEDLEEDLANVGPDDKFFIHLGDISDPGACEVSTYSNMKVTLQASSIPAFIVPGDNEWTDCSDPDQAWTFWDTHLMRLEENWSLGFSVMRQSIREENFAFVREGVLFMGINLVGGGGLDDDDAWEQLLADNSAWVNQQFNAFGHQVTSAVLFAHAFADPDRGARKEFGENFVVEAQNFGKPILYLQGDKHRFEVDHPFDDAPNVMRVIVDNDVPSLRVTISNHPIAPFTLDGESYPTTNQPPVLAAIGDKSVDEGSLLNFNAWATDPGLTAAPFTFSFGSIAPAGATIDPVTGEFRWAPTEAQGPGVYSVTINVADDGSPSLQDQETITITVNEVNRPPVLAPIANKFVNEGSLLTFAALATDPDMPANGLTYSLDAGAPAGASIDAQTGLFRWTTGEPDGPNDYAVTVRVTDGVSDDFETITITVGEIPQAPVLAAIGNQSISEGNLLTFTAAATDLDFPANNLTYRLDPGAPAGATIDATSGVFQWTPDESQGPAVYSVTVRVTDDGTPNLDDFETIQIAVSEINQAPVLSTIGNRTVDEGSSLAFIALATDADFPTNQLSYSLDANAPAGASIHAATGQFLWTPGEADGPGVYSVTVRVTDNQSPGLEDLETISISVLEVAEPPVLAAIGNRSVDEGSQLSFTATASDIDLPANQLTYSLDPGAPAGASIHPSSGFFSWTPAVGTSPGNYVVSVRVSDDTVPSLTDSESITITVNDINLPPVLATIGDQSVDEGNLLSFIASAADPDVPADNLVFSLDAGAPDGATIDPVTGQFEWMPHESQGPAVYTVTVRVTDDGTPIRDDFETIEITVGELNQSPALEEIGFKTFDEGSSLTFIATATDADLPENLLTFSLDPDAPVGTTIDPRTGQFNWAPAIGTPPGTYAVTVRVTDDSTPHLDDFETLTITVNDINLPPALSPIGARNIDEGNQLTFTAAATDYDTPANSISFSLDPGAPAGATIDPITGLFSWTPGEADGPAVYPVTVRVTDDGSPSRDSFETVNITVGEVNQPPILTAIGDQQIAEGTLLVFTASATDADAPNNNLSFRLDSDAPAGATINPVTGEFRWTPPELEIPTVFTVTVRVTDDGVPAMEDFQTISIMVSEVNQPPELAAIGDHSVDEGSPLAFTVTATDVDLPTNQLSFSLDPGAPAGAAIHPSTGQFSWTPPPGTSPGIHTVTVRVTDDGVPSLDDFETITISVNDINLSPELAPISNKSVNEGSLLAFTTSAVDHDLPADSLVFSLDAGAPLGATINPNTGLFLWSPAESQGPAVYTVTVRIRDNGTPSLDDAETLDITVGEVNRAPVLTSIGNKSIDEGSLLTFTAAANDVDLPANNLTFSLDAGAPEGATIDPSTGQFSWAPDFGTVPGTYTATVRVTDNGSPRLDDFETIFITVNDVNLPPVLAPIGAQRVDEGGLLTFTAAAIDYDTPANSFTFSLDPGAPAGASIDPISGVFGWVPGEADGPAVHTVNVRVTDDGTPNRSAFETIHIIVGDINQAPVLAAIDDKQVLEGSLLTFSASATDPDTPANNLSFSLGPNAPAGATIDPITGVFGWTPTEGQGPAVHTVSVRVADDGNPSLDDTTTFNIAVSEINQAPELAAIGDRRISEGGLLTFFATASDPDLPANDLLFSLDAGAPAGATIDPNTGQFSWSPPAGIAVGTHTVTVRVTDDAVPSLNDFETITITVDDANLPPVLSSIGARSVDEGSLLSFTASATDPDLPADNLTFSLDPTAPAGATIDPNTGLFRWTPPGGTSPGDHAITIWVKDDGLPSLGDFETITVTVNDVNLRPELTAIGAKSVDEGDLLTFTASASDADSPADTLSFSLDANAPAGATIDSNTGRFEWTPTEAQGPAVYAVTVRVTDDAVPNLDDFETIMITVREVNQAPVLASIGDKVSDEGVPLTFTASATDSDSGTHNLAFSLDAGAPAGATIHPSTGQFSWTPDEADGPAEYTVTVRVTDDGAPNLDDFETFRITVNEVNRAPVLAEIGNHRISEGTPLSFTASAFDPDTPPSNFAFSLDANAPAGATIDPSTGQFRWIPDESQGPAIHAVTIRVTDDASPSLSDFETINIVVDEVNQAPVLATIGSQRVDEGNQLTFTALATDPDLPSDSFSFSIDVGAPPGATIDANTGLFRWTPDESYGPGVYAVTVRVTENGSSGFDDFETLDITVDEVNRPPVLAAIGDRTVDEGSLITFTAVAGDPDRAAQSLTYSLDRGAPAGATIDPITGVFRWMPPEGTSPGDHPVTVRVSDDGVPSLSDVETVMITVNDINLPPTLAPIGRQTVSEGQPLILTVSATDPDLPADKLTYSLDANAPFSATIDPDTGEFNWTPGDAHGSGEFTVTIRVTDDGTPSLDDFETISIVINETNQAPHLAPIGNKRTTAGSPLTFWALANDLDVPLNRLTFSLDPGAPNGATIDPLSGRFDWTPGNADAGAVYTVTVRVTDDGTPTLDDFVTFMITVDESNQAPVLSPIANQQVQVGSPLTFTAMATDPNTPPNQLFFSLDQGAPTGATIDPNTGSFHWTPSAADSSAVYFVTVRVTDDGTPSLADLETFAITVTDPPPPRDPLDVNRDGSVTILDALAVINQIARMLGTESPAGSGNPTLSDYDTNGDGSITVLDALRVINHIAATTSVADQEEVDAAAKNSVDDDLIRLLADDHLIAGRGKQA